MACDIGALEAGESPEDAENVPSAAVILQWAKDYDSPRVKVWGDRTFKDRITSKIDQIQRALSLGTEVEGKVRYGKKDRWSKAASNTIHKWVFEGSKVQSLTRAS